MWTGTTKLENQRVTQIVISTAERELDVLIQLRR